MPNPGIDLMKNIVKKQKEKREREREVEFILKE
jgi:hypothetical protein